MKFLVNPDHLLEQDGNLIEQRPTQMRAGLMPVRRFLVIHFTSGPAPGCIDWLVTKREQNPSSAHFVIKRDGSIVQLAPTNAVTWHAGKSHWRGFDGLNSCAIGIELENWGELHVREGKAFTDSSTPREIPWSDVLAAAHKNEPKRVTHWQRYTPEQLATLTEVAKTLVARYKLDDVIGHDDIAPGRKNDPGPAFPMGDLRVACGFPREITK